jgi:hypothetical protein
MQSRASSYLAVAYLARLPLGAVPWLCRVMARIGQRSHRHSTVPWATCVTASPSHRMPAFTSLGLELSASSLLFFVLFCSWSQINCTTREKMRFIVPILAESPIWAVGPDRLAASWPHPRISSPSRLYPTCSSPALRGLCALASRWPLYRPRRAE